jgi:phosphoribosylglycinamide formyltransferase-1
VNIAVFVSGRGSNLRAIHAAVLSGDIDARLRLIVSNRISSPSLEFAIEHGITPLCIADAKAGSPDETRLLLESLTASGIDFIALAGYMRLVPQAVVAAFRHRISNIHPALLPSFGGKGMYGHHVHEAVLASGVKVSGASVHLVDEEYDRGPIVMQECVKVLDDDTVDSLAARVLEVEHRIYPLALQLLTTGRVRIHDNKTHIT